MAAALTEPVTLYDFGLTLSSVAASVVIAAVAGIAAGIVLHALPRVRQACEPFIASYYALPLFALYPVLVVIFGVGPRRSSSPVALCGHERGDRHAERSRPRPAGVSQGGERAPSRRVPEAGEHLDPGLRPRNPRRHHAQRQLRLRCSDRQRIPAGAGRHRPCHRRRLQHVPDRAHVRADAGAALAGVLVNAMLRRLRVRIGAPAYDGKTPGAARRGADRLALALAWQIASWELGTDVLPGPWHTPRHLRR